MHLTENIKASEFFQMINNIFYIMNNKCLEHLSNKPLKAAFRDVKYFDQQEQLLNYVKTEISKFWVSQKKNILPF